MSELCGVLVALHVYVHNKENLQFVQIYAAEVVECSVYVYVSPYTSLTFPAYAGLSLPHAEHSIVLSCFVAFISLYDR